MKHTKYMKNLILLLIFVHACGKANGQFSIQLFPANDLTLAARDLWNCAVVNSTNGPYRVYLRGTITEQKSGMIYDVISATFDLQPGVTNFNTANNELLKPETVVFSVSSYVNYVTRTNSLPRGEYTFCAYVVDAGQLNVLAEDCFEATVATSTPPMVISPTPGDSICTSYPFFIWSPPQPALSGPDVSYTIQLFEVTPNQTALAAILQNPVWYSESNIPTPIYQYSIVGRSFELNKTYAWYVIAYEGNQAVAQSDVGTFVFKDCNPIDSIEVELTDVPTNVPRFLLHDVAINRSVVVKTPDVHFTYISSFQTGTSLMQIMDDAGLVLHEKVIEVVPGYNYLTAIQSEWNLVPGKHYTLHLLDKAGKISVLKFWYQPESASN